MWRYSLLLGLMSLGCAPRAQEGPGVTTGEPTSGREETAAARRETASAAEPAGGAQARRAHGGRDAQGQSGRARRYCDQGSSAGCRALEQARALIDAGKADEALGKLQLIDGLSALESQYRVLLGGQAKLEMDELAYGAGGARALEALRDFDALLAEAVKASPLRDEVRVQRARALLSLGRGEDAVEELEEVVVTFASDAEIQAALGIAYLSLGKVSKSLGPLRRAARLDRAEPERHIVLGTALMLMGSLPEAARSFRAAIHLDGDSARAHGNLGSVLILQGDSRGGLQHLRRATLLAPRRATFVSNLSYAELLNGEPQDAKSSAEKAIRLDSKLASGWLNLGLCQVELGDRVQARLSFEKAAALDPSDPRPKNNLLDLDELEQGAALPGKIAP